MTNDCYPGVFYEILYNGTGDDVDTPFDHWGISYDPVTWVQKCFAAADDQMCETKDELAALIAAAEVTGAAVRDALGAPLPALTPASGGSIATLQVLGLTVIAGSSVGIIQNLVTRVGELEDRLQTLELLQ